MLLLSSCTKGELTGYFSLPASTECSRMWNTPVSSEGKVPKPMPKALLTVLVLHQQHGCAADVMGEQGPKYRAARGQSSVRRTV